MLEMAMASSDGGGAAASSPPDIIVFVAAALIFLGIFTASRRSIRHRPPKPIVQSPHALHQSTSRPWLAICLVVAGVIGLVASMNMDTSVPVGDGNRVHNIGLMKDQENFLILSAVALIVGVVLYVARRRG